MQIDEKKIKELVCNETSSFALCLIDIKNSEVIYTNSAMQEIMFNKETKKCWESIYGFDSVCSWCKLKNHDDITNKSLDIASNQTEFEYEYFNEMTSKWYQVESTVRIFDDDRKVLVMIALDISRQKKAQGNLISTQFRLAKQTQELEEAQENLKLLASTDPMTKLYNRRYFMQVSESILSFSKRKKTATTLLMLDIDKFKRINDTYGHNIGDDVIIVLSKILKQNSRTSDVICRWGGEEFIILLPDTIIDDAYQIAEKIRQIVEKFEVEVEANKVLNFTISIGVAEFYIESDLSIESPINRADEALYKAKNSGRNKVCLSEIK